ncbi:amidase [Cadophora sp. DSE1049]|nr:amidase [Cadophora sp. DSE1049]
MSSVAGLNSESEITVGDVRYLLVQNQDVNFYTNCSLANKDPTPVLVYPTAPGQTISKSDLCGFRANTLDKDDVFQPQFFQHIVFYGARKGDFMIDQDAINELAAWNTKSQSFVEGNPNANVASVMLDAPRAGTDGRVIVPSRCYFKASKELPLHGARIAVKDNFDIEGHKTTLCNRAWIEFYPAATKNAACVQTLVNAGAIIVGKVKLQAMIMREEPLECVEFTAPFNPRADGYQVPSGSSNGSAAAIASYDWLDFSLGSDTNGSNRKPASYNGTFSIRPSTGILDTDGVVGVFPLFDMPAFFNRDMSKFSAFISVWYGKSPMIRAPSKASIKILYPADYLPTVNEAQTRLIDKFVAGLESALRVKRTDISLAELWKKDIPDGSEHSDIAEYLKTAGIYPFYHDAYYALSGFRDGYAEKYGKPPFVHRALLWQWEVGKAITHEDRDECWRRSELYRHWLLSRVFEADSKDCITVMVLPIEVGKPNYRDAELPPLNSLLSGYASLNMSPMARAPEVTAPVGDIPYQSIVTKREEPLPVAVSLIGPPGTDLILADLVEQGLKGANIPTLLKTGRSMY